MLKKFSTTSSTITVQSVNNALAGIKNVKNGTYHANYGYSVAIVPMAGADTTLIYDVVTAFLGEADKGMKYRKDGAGNIVLYFGHGGGNDKDQRNAYRDNIKKMLSAGAIVKIDSNDPKIAYTGSGEKYVFTEAQSLGTNYGDTIKNLLGGDGNNTITYAIIAIIALLLVVLIIKKKKKK